MTGRVQEAGFKHRIARKRPWLNSSHKNKKLQFAKDYYNFTVEDWKKVLFTDESPYKLTNSKGRRYVWRRKGEEFKEACLTPKFRENAKSKMVWWCIAWSGPGPSFFALKMLMPNTTKALYRKIFL